MNDRCWFLGGSTPDFLHSLVLGTFSARSRGGADGPQVLRTRGYPKVRHFQRRKYNCFSLCVGRVRSQKVERVLCAGHFQRREYSFCSLCGMDSLSLSQGKDTRNKCMR